MRPTRRRFVRYVAGGLPVALAGGIARPGDPITMLAVNQDDTPHSVTVWAVQGGTLTVENTVGVAGRDVETLGQMPWKAAQYRVTVFVDAEVALAEEFHSGQWFNQLDVFIASDGSVKLNRARAG